MLRRCRLNNVLTSSPSWFRSPENVRLSCKKVAGGGGGGIYVVVGKNSQIPSDVQRKNNSIHQVDNYDSISNRAEAKVEGKAKRTERVERLTVSRDDPLSQRSLGLVERESK